MSFEAYPDAYNIPLQLPTLPRSGTGLRARDRWPVRPRLTRRRQAGVSGVGRLVLVSLFLLGTRCRVRSRTALAVRLAVLLRPSFITRFIVLTGAAVGLFGLTPGRAR